MNDGLQSRKKNAKLLKMVNMSLYSYYEKNHGEDPTGYFGEMADSIVIPINNLEYYSSPSVQVCCNQLSED